MESQVVTAYSCKNSAAKQGMCRRWCGNSEVCPSAREEAKAPFIVYVDMVAVDVRKHYADKYKMELPPTPTMSGIELKIAGRGHIDPMYYVSFRDGDGSMRIVGETEALPLKHGMHFGVAPPATY